MAYSFYLDRVLLPVTPSKLQIKIKNQNKNINLINGGEVSLLKKAGLSSIDFNFLLPNIIYPFASYTDGFKKASFYLQKLEELKQSLAPFQFIVVRLTPGGLPLYNSNIKVSLEEYSITEDVKNGLDVVVDIKLKQYRDIKLKTFTLSETNGKVITVTNNRSSNSEYLGIGSNVILNGRVYRDSHGNGAGIEKLNYQCKINFVNLNGTHPYHVTTPNGEWLGWVSSSSIKGV